MQAPAKFSPSGKYLARVLREGSDATVVARDLDVPAGEQKDVVVFDPAKCAEFGTHKPSVAEQLRMERLRRVVKSGLDEFIWASEDQILVTSHGCLYIAHVGPEPEEPRVLVHAATVGGAPMDVKTAGGLVAFWAAGEVYVTRLDGTSAVFRATAGDDALTRGLSDYVSAEEFERSYGFQLSHDGNTLCFQESSDLHIPEFAITHFADPDPHSRETVRFPFPGKGNPRIRLGVVSLAEITTPAGATAAASPGEVTELAAAAAPSWLDLGPGFEYVARFEFAPDGSLMVQVLDRRQQRLDLVRFDAGAAPAGGVVPALDVLIREERDTWINHHDMLMFLPLGANHGSAQAGARPRLFFLWASERTGFRHLALFAADTLQAAREMAQLSPTAAPVPLADSVDLAASLRRQLTAGNWLVTDLCGVNAESGYAYFVGNAASPLQTHLYRTPLTHEAAAAATTGGGGGLASGDRDQLTGMELVDWGDHAADLKEWGHGLGVTGVQRLTRGRGCYSATLHAASGRAVLSHSHGERKPSTVLVSLSGGPPQLVATLSGVPFLVEAEGSALAAAAGGEADEAEEAEDPMPRPEVFTCVADDGKTTLFGALWRPRASEFGPGPYKTVVLTYGGPHVQLVRDSWHSLGGNRSASKLCAAGYALLVLDNRGSFNRGHAFEAQIYRRMGTVEVDDQAAGVRACVQHGAVDAASVGVRGWSYGGYMTLLCLAKKPDVFCAGLSGAPVTFWEGYDTAYTERYMDLPASNPDGYRESSVLEHVEGIKGKLTIIHGLLDENVHFRHTARLLDRLVAKGIDHRIVLLPSERHGPRSPGAVKFVGRVIMDFFEGALGKPCKVGEGAAAEAAGAAAE